MIHFCCEEKMALLRTRCWFLSYCCYYSDMITALSKVLHFHVFFCLLGVLNRLEDLSAENENYSRSLQ